MSETNERIDRVLRVVDFEKIQVALTAILPDWTAKNLIPSVDSLRKIAQWVCRDALHEGSAHAHFESRLAGGARGAIGFYAKVRADGSLRLAFDLACAEG